MIYFINWITKKIMVCNITTNHETSHVSHKTPEQARKYNKSIIDNDALPWQCPLVYQF